MRCIHIPKNKKLFSGFMEVGIKYRTNPQDAPVVLWQPYFQDLVDNTLDAAKTSDNVVVTFAANQQVYVDFVMKKLKEGGADANNTKLMFLTMNEDVKLKGLYSRFSRQAEAGGITKEDLFRTIGWEGVAGSECTLDIFMKWRKDKKSNDDKAPFDPPPSYAIIVDVSTRDVLHLDNVDNALGLQRNTNLLYEDIVMDVLAIDHKRDEDNPYDMIGWKELSNEIKNRSDEERQQIKKRHSSLIELERALGETRISISDDDAGSVGSSSDSDSNARRRRQSLIMTGKIE
jgi:hypothetical protein